MPAEDKLSLHPEDPSRSCKLHKSNLNYHREAIHLWRDNLRHTCHPLEDCLKHWPEKPNRYREVVGAYSTEAKKLGSIILKLIADGLGPESGYFKNQLGERLLSSINHYPPCPGPSLTLGLPKHCDPNLITIHFQGDVSGLQIISNNKVKSEEHRAVRNSKEAGTSAAFSV
ncbi:hypothetical protein WN943_016822 [Citrus x changshan-huyou]